MWREGFKFQRAEIDFDIMGTAVKILRNDKNSTPNGILCLSLLMDRW